MATLVLTLGGSPDPIVHAIEQNRPDRVVLIGSRDPAKPDDGFASSVSLIPGILARANLREDRVATEPVAKPDDFLEVWQVCERIAAATDDRIIANYTGGTKTMSAAVAAFALLHEWELQVQVARRTDLIRVTSSDRARLQGGIHVARMRLVIGQARAYHQRGDYEGAIKLLESAPAAQHVDDTALHDEVDLLIAECRFHDALDRFDYDGAEALLRDRAQRLGERFGRTHGRRLREIRESLAWMADPAAQQAPKGPFLLVDELLDNAQRTAARGRYDDAFSRLYRATELTAQIALRLRHDLVTADLDLTRVPPDFASPAPDDRGTVKIGLMRSWELLAALGDPLGTYFGSRGAVLSDLLPLRNASWLAHGFAPVNADTWRARGASWLAWLRDALAVARTPSMKRAAADGNAVAPESETIDVGSLYGRYKHFATRPVSVDEMNEAIAEAASESYRGDTEEQT